MTRDRLHFLLLNIGHFLDHLFTLIFATVAALALIGEWNIGYAQLLTYATPGFVAFGLFSWPAGWLADKWCRDGMMAVFFLGSGVAAIATSYAQTPLQIGAGLFLIGIFAAIYHPVGLAIVTMKWRNTGMRIAINGVWGNLGVAAAALLTGYLIDNGGWRLAFALPGWVSTGFGFAYIALRRQHIGRSRQSAPEGAPSPSRQDVGWRSQLIRISLIVFLTTALASVVFQSTTFALPKIFAERLGGLSNDLAGMLISGTGTVENGAATIIGLLAFLVFAIASTAQLLVGSLLDRFGPRRVYMVVALVQMLFFSLMPGRTDAAALLVGLGFMLGAFGQIPINDFLIGKTASGTFRATAYGIRYVVAFSALALSLPLIAYVYDNWGFDTLFQILAITSAGILIAVSLLPKKLPLAVSPS